MIYMIGYFVAFFGLIIMLVGFKDFYSKINKMNRAVIYLLQKYVLEHGL